MVFRKDFLENGKWYLLLFLTMTGILGVILIWRSLFLYNKIAGGSYTDVNGDLLIFMTFLFPVFGILFASTIMKPMNNKVKRIFYLISPSSNLEKYLSRWMIITIGYIIAFFISFWIVDALRVGICSARYPDLDIRFMDLRQLISPGEGHPGNYFFYSKSFFGIAVGMYLFFQSIFILGATFWEKATFIKTFSAGVIITIAFILICRWTILLFYGDFNSFFNMLSSFEPQMEGRLDEDKVFTGTAFILSVCALINWTLAFFRFRESEIIKRF
jgi:hypothetical protein